MTTKVKKAITNKKVLKPKVEKPKEDAHKELEDYNKKSVTQQVIINRELKYRYPKGCKDTLSRKSFRQKVRNKLRALEREIHKSRGEDRRLAKEALESYQSQVLI